MHGISATAIAGEGDSMQRDYAWRMARHLADLPPPEEIGQHGRGQRAVHRLNPGRLKSGPVPVVFDPRVGGSLISHLGRGNQRQCHCPPRQFPAWPRG
jgi:PmbA protein